MSASVSIGKNVATSADVAIEAAGGFQPISLVSQALARVRF